MPDTKQPTLSACERRLFIEVDRILYQNYLAPETVTDFWAGDRDAVIWHLRQMKERIVRSIVVTEYVEVDDVLNRAILRKVVVHTSKANNDPGRLLKRCSTGFFRCRKSQLLSHSEVSRRKFRGT
jgi:hypothetical protein